MIRLSRPPRIKVLEALGAVAGGRVTCLSDSEAVVAASEGQRAYKVFVDLDKRVAESDDNGTVYRNYVGYPIIAFLMARKVLPYFEEVGRPLATVKWRSINEKYKSYRAVEAVIKSMLSKQGVSSHKVDEIVALVLDKLDELQLSKHST
ncbi:MAG: hypothetical protein RMH74_02870 [Candidatus Caldarchaeum sp.]|nr:hypothetical protein [Candidatus Caldarchaeum sp.]